MSHCLETSEPATWDLTSRQVAKKNGWILLWIGWVLFLASLFLPAGTIDMGAWNQPDTASVPGLVLALWFPYFYPSNLLILLSPLFYAFFRGRSLLTGVFSFSAVGALLCIQMLRTVHIAYVFWVTSFILIAVAFWLRPIQPKPLRDYNSTHGETP